MTDDSFRKFMHHVRSMSQLTNIELVNTYWQHAQGIARTGRLAFIIRGNLSWESKQPQGVIDGSGLWLKSNRYEPIGKHIAEKPIQTYLQWYMNIYEIWGTIPVDIDPNNASASRPLIKQALEKVTCVSNTMSLLYGTSLYWLPANYTRIRHEPLPPPPEQEITESWDCVPLRRSQNESTSFGISDASITNQLFPLVDKIEAISPPIQTVIKTAIDWHAQANRYASGLNRFVNYWESIELLGNFFFNKLPANVVGRKSKNQKKDEIMILLQEGITPNNCMDIVKRCDEIRKPVARTKIRGLLNAIADKATDRDLMEAALFEPDDKIKKSLYEIRNDIAHGVISEHDFETVAALSHRLVNAQRISEEIILRSITCSEKLMQQLSNKRLKA